MSIADDIARVEQNIGELEQRVERQRAVIAHAEEGGLPTEAPRNFLWFLKETLSLSRDHLARLITNEALASRNSEISNRPTTTNCGHCDVNGIGRVRQSDSGMGASSRDHDKASREEERSYWQSAPTLRSAEAIAWPGSISLEIEAHGGTRATRAHSGSSSFTDGGMRPTAGRASIRIFRSSLAITSTSKLTNVRFAPSLQPPRSPPPLSKSRHPSERSRGRTRAL